MSETGAHTLIVGTTESGKTTLARLMCAQYRALGIKTIVLDPLNDPQWNADFQTRDPAEFLAVVRASRQCGAFIDEGSENIGRFDTEMHFCTTQARHLGHRMTIICQKPTQIAPVVRDNCSQVAAFRIAPSGAKLIADDYTQRALLGAVDLNKGEYLYTGRFNSQVEKRRVF